MKYRRTMPSISSETFLKPSRRTRVASVAKRGCPVFFATAYKIFSAWSRFDCVAFETSRCHLYLLISYAQIISS